MKRDGLNLRHAGLPAALLLAGGVLLGGCMFLGGQTGEADSLSGADGTGGMPCGTLISIPYDEPSSWGFSGADLVDTFGGTWVGTLETSAGSAPALLLDATAGEAFPVTVLVSHRGGTVLASDCERDLEVEVWVTLTVGTWLSRAGTAHLIGDPDSATLEIELPAANDGSPEPATLLLTFDPDAGATGSLIVGDWQGELTATPAD